MRIDVLTLFPRMFAGVLGESILKRAQKKGAVKIILHNLRDYAQGKHKKVDDYPYGGGPGMVLACAPIFRAVEKIIGRKAKQKNLRVVLLSPQGKRLDQKLAQKFLRYKRLLLICGHYEGVDERVREKLVTDEISIGDYVLTCGELPAMVFIDALVRLLPGVLGDENSTASESFSEGLLEYPHYTRPADFRGMKVPAVLLSGNHQAVDSWRRQQALKRTRKRRPDLLRK
jgi:tRNA (guanine37-N1)-methyltransferase